MESGLFLGAGDSGTNNEKSRLIRNELAGTFALGNVFLYSTHQIYCILLIISIPF